MIGLIVLLVIAIIVLHWGYNVYTGLIMKRNSVKHAMSGVDVQLNKRYDLIPNILTIANKFMEHEKELITSITALRAKAVELQSDGSLSEKIKLDEQIASKMGQLMVNVENYPQLKSDATMIQAMQTYSEIEEHIAAARRFYNSAVMELNNVVEIFPSSIIAAYLGIKSYPFFEADNSAKKSINASDYLYKKN